MLKIIVSHVRGVPLVPLGSAVTKKNGNGICFIITLKQSDNNKGEF